MQQVWPKLCKGEVIRVYNRRENENMQSKMLIMGLPVDFWFFIYTLFSKINVTYKIENDTYYF